MNYLNLTKNELITIIERLKEQKNDQSRDLFISNISHDIRTLLNAIYGNAQILNNSISLSENHKTSINKIMDASSHLIDLINDIIDISKNSGDDKVILCEFNLNDFLNNIFSIFESIATSKKITLYLENHIDKNTVIRCDKNKLFYIFLNLLSNAVKFTQKGSITINAKYEKNQIYFEIIDTGIGIKENFIAEIVKNYIQASSINKSEGTGLGLGIAVENIKLLGSKLEISSIYGEGSTFSFSIKHVKNQKTFLTTQDDIFSIKEIKTIIGKQSFDIIVYSKDENQLEIMKNYFTLKNISYKILIDLKDIELFIDLSKNQIIFIDTTKIISIELEKVNQLKKKFGAVVWVALTASVMSDDLSSMNEKFTTYIVKPYSFIDIDQVLILFAKQQFKYIDIEEINENINLIIDDNLKEDIINQSTLCHYKNTFDLIKLVSDDNTKKRLLVLLENYDFDEIIMEINT